MKKVIITAGQLWNDIDAYACAIAYKELCDLKNIPAEVVLSGPLNESITKSVHDIKTEYKTELIGDPKDYDYVLVDISDPNHFASFVVPEQIYEIYDHRWGFEKYWQDRLGEKAKIDQVGSCTTLIWEEFKRSKLSEQISPASATLLYTGTISNTLNLNAQITDKRDRQALKELEPYAKLSENWVVNYYKELSESVLKYPEQAMRNDTKIITAEDEKYAIIQTELWENETFIQKNISLIKQILQTLPTPHAFLTSPNISQGFNYIITQDEYTKSKLSEKIKAKFDGDVGKTDKLWLRKEIMRELNN
jgi:inorganic pyrophosphatase/exopolyphosphatase